MSTLQQTVVGIIVLAIVAVVVSNKQTPALIGAAGQFLAGMAKRVVGS